jgi:hypothetical protein
MYSNFKLKKLNEAQDLWMMIESKKDIKEMIQTENRILQIEKETFDIEF